MTNLEFYCRSHPDVLVIPPGDKLTLNMDPEYDEPGTVLIGMWRAGEYHSIVLIADMAWHLAAAIQAKIGVNSSR